MNKAGKSPAVQQPHSHFNFLNELNPQLIPIAPFCSLLLFVLVAAHPWLCVVVVSLFPAPDSFCYKKFFQLCGLSSKSPEEIKKVFQILDKDSSGYIEESELKCVKRWHTELWEEMHDLLAVIRMDSLFEEQFIRIRALTVVLGDLT